MVNPVVPEESTPLLFTHSLERLVASHHYLCQRAARKFLRGGLERCDLEQVAAIGLIKAARRFDPATRTPFEAYAWIIIVGELMHYVRDHECIVRVPRRLRALETQYIRTRERLTVQFGREPNDDEIAVAMCVLRTTVIQVKAARIATETLALEDADVSQFSDRSTFCAEDRLLVRISFNALSTIERSVIAGLYVLGLTQFELAHRLAISPKRVSRLHRSALAQMQRAWAS